MSQISVVHYNSPHNHLNVLQNTVTNKQSDRQIIVLRKPQQTYITPETTAKDDILIANTARKKHKTEKDPKPNLQPVSVARRNARERNRVKQVNDGFATLRQHIPNFIAAAFENTSGRGGNKKLSKVETLRMAVEYIRSLEHILAMDTDNADISESLYRSPSSSISPSSSQQNATFSYILSTEDDDDMSSDISPPPQQFIKLDATNTYHLIPNVHYENAENLDPMSVDEDILSDPSLLDHNIEFDSQELSYLNNVHTTASLSPGFQSESSMSPGSVERSTQGYFIPVFDSPQGRLSPTMKVEIKSEVDEFPVISLKNDDELPSEPKCNIVDVLHWWDQQQNTGS
ncbi:unnamed protein product [Phaedon cochleariae]|uniref:BHLH domain-containing protein n=1 Tax=Phaedon cochleariae TaxID=80249 RepID=A0A9N9X399_PHACE|nr:unnamed protein product [Phaedon cochleariae]